MNEKQKEIILLVEDDELDRMAVERTFKKESLPYTLITVGTTTAAKECLQKGGIDLVLLDQNLPDGTGLELQEQFADEAIIFMTGEADTNTAVSAMKAGAYDYLVKDMGRDYLRLLPISIENALQRRKNALELEQYRLQLEGEVQKRTIELQRVNEQLADSEAKYRLLVENAHEAISMMDADGNYLLLNNEAAKLLGGQPNDFIGKNILDILPQEHAETHLDSVRNIIQLDQGHTVETAVPLPDGLHWFNSSSQPVHNLEGNVSGVMSISRDVTERKMVDDALQALATTFTGTYGQEFFVEISKYLTSVLQVDFAFTGHLIQEGSQIEVIGGFGNGAPLIPFAYDLVGTPCEKVVGQEPCLHFSGVQEKFPDDSLLAEMDIEGYVASPISDKSGEPLGIMVLLSSKPIKNQNPMLTLLRIFSERVSAEIERKNADDSLRQLTQAIEQSPVSVVITDLNGQISYVNPKFTQVTGYQAKEAIGQHTRLLQSGYHSENFYAEMWKSLLENGVWRGEFQNRKKNGDLFWELASIASVKDRKGITTHYVAVKEDITEQKQKDKEHIRQERLAAVGQLAAGIAHDFNNVMAVISLYSDLLQSSPNLTEKERNHLKTIFKQAHHAAELTNQILDFSRRSVREPRPMSLKLFCKETLKFIERTIPERIVVKISYDRDDYLVNADPTQLQQVITNLIVNARDAMPQSGEINFTLSRFVHVIGEPLPYPDLAFGNWIKLTVEDTGEGIDPEVLPHIFEPFFTTKEAGKGTGLGLAQVYGIIQQHDGLILVESRLEEGTRFEIYLPALVKTGDKITEQNSTTLPLGNDETVLLVEDNHTLLEAMQDTLETLNYNVLVARNGEEGLTVYQQNSNKIKFILTDVVMPKMGGVEFIQTLQQYAPEAKIFLMTGFPLDVDLPHDLKPMIAELLTKPLKVEQIAHLFQDAIN